MGIASVLSVSVNDVCARMRTSHVPADPDDTQGTTFGGPIIGRGSYATSRSGGRMGHMQHSGLVAEVEVDTDTGEVTVEKCTEVAADGRTIHWKGEMSQIHSGIVFSLGHGLYTGTIRDEPTGVLLNPDYSNFKIPTMADCPSIAGRIWLTRMPTIRRRCSSLGSDLGFGGLDFRPGKFGLWFSEK